MAFNRAPSNPSDQIVSLGDLYTKIKVPNRLFNALDLFSVETHDTLNVSLDRLLDKAEQVFNDISGQNAQYGVPDNGGYMITKFNRNSKVHVHHAGPAIKSALMAGEQGEFLQYMLPVNEWGFPTVVSEFSMLAVNNLPQSTFSLSIKA